MPAPSWNLAIAAVFLIGIAFGYILQKEKIIATLFSVYVSLVITSAASGLILQFFHGDKTFGQFWINANSSPFTVKAVLFIGVIMLLSTKVELTTAKTKGIISPLEIIIYSIMVTGLVLSTIFSFMPTETLGSFTTNSNLAKIVIQNQIWWIVGPVIFMFVSGFLHKGSD